MGAQMRIYRQRIKSVNSIKKITNAMELIAAARVVKARQRATEAALAKVVDEVKFTFRGTGKDGLEAGNEEFDEIADDQITQAKIVKQK